MQCTAGRVSVHCREGFSALQERLQCTASETAKIAWYFCCRDVGICVTADRTKTEVLSFFCNIHQPKDEFGLKTMRIGMAEQLLLQSITIRFAQGLGFPVDGFF